MIVMDYNTLGKKSAKNPGVLNDTKKKRKTKRNKEINNKDNKNKIKMNRYRIECSPLSVKTFCTCTIE